MIKPPLSVGDKAALMADLRGSHSIRQTIHVLNRNEQVIESLTPRLLGGGVQFDLTQEVTRQLQVTLLDPKRKLQFDANSPALGALYADRFLAVEYGVYGPNLGRWEDIPVFWGPVTAFRRQGPQVDVVAMGKESLLREPVWETLNFPRGTKKVHLIRQVAESYGEQRFDLPDLDATLDHRVSVHRRQEGWTLMQKVAKSMDRQLFYNGQGRLTLRRWPHHPSFTFQAGAGGTLLTDPDLTFDISQVRNTIHVVARKKGSKKSISYTATPPRNHPLSPWSLARNGQPRHLVEVVELDHGRTRAELVAVGHRVLNDKLDQVVNATFDALPMPLLEEGDMDQVDTGDWAMPFRIRQATLPLTAEESMSLGYLKRVKPNRKMIR